MGAPHYTVALQKIAAEQGLTVLHAAQDYATREIRTADVNRPGLQLAGFYNYFDPERMQIIGRVESTYLETLTPDQRRERFEQFMRYNIIGLVICHGMDPFPECLEMAEKYDRNLFLVRKDTSEFMAASSRMTARLRPGPTGIVTHGTRTLRISQYSVVRPSRS